MESSLKNEIKVGIFTAVGLVLFCISVILLGGDKWFLKKTYQLRVHLTQVQGLGRGSIVSLSGVPIGNVSDINFIDKSMDVEVFLNLEQAVQPKITEGSRVSIKTQGALGDKYIFIDPGPMEGKPLPAGSLLETDKTPDFFDVVAAKGAQLGEIVQVIKEVRVLFEGMNKDGKSAKLMGSLVSATENFNLFMTEARETFKVARMETLAPLSSVMKKIDRGQGSLGALVNDPSLHNKLNGFLGEAPRNRFLKPLIRNSIQTSEGKN